MDGLTVLVAVLVVFHVAVFALAPLLSEHRRRAFRRRFRVPMRPLAIAWTATLVACILFAAVGELPLEVSMGRRETRAVGTVGLLLVAGSTVGVTGLVAGALVGRRVLRLRLGGSELPGEIVVTGRAFPTGDGEAEPGPSPVFERLAVCWAWTLEAYDRGGGDTGWTTARAGSGGTSIRIESDDDVAVTVEADFDRSHVDVPLSDSTIQPPDAPAPGRLERLTDTDVGGSEHRYSEGVVAPGETVTVVGEADAEGRIRDDGSLEPWIAAGDRSTVVRRLELLAFGYAVGGAVCLFVSLPQYLSWLHLR